MCVTVCVYVCVCMRVWVHVYICVCVCVCLHVRACGWVGVRVCENLHIVCMRAPVCVHMHV